MGVDHGVQIDAADALGSFHRRCCVLPLQGPPARVAATQALVRLLHRDRPHPWAFQGGQHLEPVSAVGRMRQRQRLDPGHHFLRRGDRVAPGDRRQTLQPAQALKLTLFRVLWLTNLVSATGTMLQGGSSRCPTGTGPPIEASRRSAPVKARSGLHRIAVSQSRD